MKKNPAYFARNAYFKRDGASLLFSFSIKALSFWSVELRKRRRTRLLFYQLLITKTTAEELVSEN